MAEHRGTLITNQNLEKYATLDLHTMSIHLQTEHFNTGLLCLSPKFPHQEIRWNDGIFCSERLGRERVGTGLPTFYVKYDIKYYIIIFCHLLLFVVTRCHLLSLIVTRCTIRCNLLYHSLSFVVTRCHSLSLVIRLVVTWCTLVCLFTKDLLSMFFIM